MRWSPSRLVRPAEPGRPKVHIAVDRCVGCQECLTRCPSGAITLMPDAWAVTADDALCRGCRRCERACPIRVVTVSGRPRTRRQVVTDRLLAALRQGCPADFVVTGELPLSTSERGQSHVMRPTLAVVSAQAWKREAVRPKDVLLAVAVTGPRTRVLDLGTTRELYRKCGVGAYWTVEQDTGKPRVHWSKGAPWLATLAGRCFSG